MQNNKMKLYHGSNMAIKEPRIIEPNRHLDFGAGFYTTANEEQAMVFAKKVAERTHMGSPTVSIYEIDWEKVRKNMKVLYFKGPTRAWVDFVAANRSGKNTNDGYDIIVGPVANDDVFTTVDLLLGGVITWPEAIRRLKVKNLFNQYTFMNERAISELTYIGEVGKNG